MREKVFFYLLSRDNCGRERKAFDELFPSILVKGLSAVLHTAQAGLNPPPDYQQLLTQRQTEGKTVKPAKC